MLSATCRAPAFRTPMRMFLESASKLLSKPEGQLNGRVTLGRDNRV
ncbi:MAG: hypothetical protein WA265_20960 [Rhodomicrobium sp.]